MADPQAQQAPTDVEVDDGLRQLAWLAKRTDKLPAVIQAARLARSQVAEAEARLADIQTELAPLEAEIGAARKRWAQAEGEHHGRLAALRTEEGAAQQALTTLRQAHDTAQREAQEQAQAEAARVRAELVGERAQAQRELDTQRALAHTELREHRAQLAELERAIATTREELRQLREQATSIAAR